MKREIKFRAWDGEKMTDTIRLEFAHGLRLVSTSDLGFDMIGDDKCELMQYTGLKDKNGFEIYEGDIVRHGNGARGEVLFKYGGFLVKEIGQFDGLISSLNDSDWEVIGNIYE